MSVTSPVPPPVGPAGTRRGASRLGYWAGGGLVAAGCIGAAAWVVLAFFGLTNQVNGFQRTTVPGTATVHVAQAATRVLYFEGPRTAPPSGQLSIQVKRARNVRATFFLTGTWVRDFPAQANLIVQDGFLAGNHSVTHPYFTQLTDAQVNAEVQGAQQAILRANGADTRPLFRFPYGDVNSRVLADVNGLGYVSVRWTVDSLGWKGTSGGQTVQKVTDRVLAAAQPGEIVLMHPGSNPDDGTTLDAAAPRPSSPGSGPAATALSPCKHSPAERLSRRDLE